MLTCCVLRFDLVTATAADHRPHRAAAGVPVPPQARRGRPRQRRQVALSSLQPEFGTLVTQDSVWWVMVVVVVVAVLVLVLVMLGSRGKL